MVKRSLSFLLAIALACGATACKGKPNPAAVAAQQQKEFQDKQRLTLIKVYDDLAKKFPDSQHAADAKARAAKLRQDAGLQGTAPAKK